MTFPFFFKLLKESFRDLLPIISVILVFQLLVLQSIPDGWQSTTVGMIIVGVGLAIFLMGLEIGIFPVGEKLAQDFALKGSTVWILLFGFLIGFGTTIAEPALAVIAQKAAAISSGKIDADILRFVVAFSVGSAIVLGVYRIIKGYPIHYFIIAGYILVVTVTFFAPAEIIGLSYDLGGVTTSTVTVPLVTALGIGLASTIKGRNPVIDGFGLIAFASLTPMIFVQVYGIIAYSLVDTVAVVSMVDINTSVQAAISSLSAASNAVAIPQASAVAEVTLQSVITGIISVVKDVTPILAIIFFFQYVVLRKKIENVKEVIFGFALVILGLYAFILGLELGLFSLGESMAYQLTNLGSNPLIYAFAFAIGFSTTMAEPALMAIAKKSKEISDGKINDFTLRIFVASGVAIGIALGAFRIVDGGHIHYYIIVGYLIVIILTHFAPKYIIPIAYDSGGVTTSTVTVPLVAALGLGLATNIPGRSPLIDGFGLIAFASLFPMITVMVYGIFTERVGLQKSDSSIEHDHVIHAKFNGVDDMELSTINVVDSDTVHQSSDFSFSAVVVIVPKHKKEDALHAARDAGATGVTILDGQGMGLKKMANMYRMEIEASDAVMLFVLPDALVNNVIKFIIHRLHITSSGDGIAFAMPLTHVKGISLHQKHILEEEVEEIEEIKKEHQH